MRAATHGPIPFDSRLLHWPRIDSTARAHAKGEIDGLDGDSYLNARDPCDAYTVKVVRSRGADLLVDVLGHGGCPKHQKPDVTVALRAVDRERLRKRLGVVTPATLRSVLNVLAELFEPWVAVV